MTYADLTSAPILEEFDRRAEDVVYNGLGLRAIFRFAGVEDVSNRSGSTSASKGTLKVLKTDVPDPAYSDTAVINSETWKVMNKLPGGGMHTFKLAIERARGRVM